LSLCPSQYTVYKRVEGYGFSTIKSYEELYCFHLLGRGAEPLRRLGHQEGP
jgi:hypothetical protein